MSFLFEEAATLRELADSLERDAARALLPVQTVSLQDAHDRLRAVAGPNAYLTIAVELGFFGHNDKQTAQWTIYSSETAQGAARVTGPTLADALNAALAAHKPPSADPVLQTQQLLDAAGAAEPLAF